ncbi:diguanylate cyclase domain-containing protein [Roseateles sp.]|uniref:diguanylate cyclase domain-containing protein n=1 Tax=Roseateles sp. TaxID=1971397 RepID=UPI0039EB3447
MSVTYLNPQDAFSSDRDSYTPGLPRVESLPELASHLSRRLARCRRAGEQLAMLWIELEPLPSPAAEVGDVTEELMRMASLRVRNRVRSTDEVIQVGEQGFAVLLPGAGNMAAEIVALRLRQTLAGTYELEGQLTYLAVAAGQAVFPEGGSTGTELTQTAQRNLAMQQGA